MEVPNGEVFASREPLQILVGMRLPVKVSFQIAKLTKILDEHFQLIDTVRNKLIADYGEVNVDGIPEVIPPNDLRNRPVSPNWVKFITEFNELMAQAVELNVEKIQLPSEIDGKPLQIEPSVLMVLEKFIDIVG